jgi:hypothetical protein
MHRSARAQGLCSVTVLVTGRTTPRAKVLVWHWVTAMAYRWAMARVYHSGKGWEGGSV